MGESRLLSPSHVFAAVEVENTKLSCAVSTARSGRAQGCADGGEAGDASATCCETPGLGIGAVPPCVTLRLLLDAGLPTEYTSMVTLPVTVPGSAALLSPTAVDRVLGDACVAWALVAPTSAAAAVIVARDWNDTRRGVVAASTCFVGDAPRPASADTRGVRGMVAGDAALESPVASF